MLPPPSASAGNAMMMMEAPFVSSLAFPSVQAAVAEAGHFRRSLGYMLFANLMMARPLLI